MRGVICLSGGIDSTVLAYKLHDEGVDLYSLAFHYGQSHYREIDCARRIARTVGIPHRLFDFEPLVGRGGNALTGGEGSPVVPNRNATMLALAVTYASGIGASEVYYCPTKDDFELFPDCRPGFVEAFNAMLAAGECEVRVSAPFVTMGKAEVAALGAKLNVPLEETWSCYAGGREPCGECLACETRKEALACI